MGIFLKTKFQSISRFQEIQSYCREKKRGIEIKTMRFDQGREFSSKEFQVYCSPNGIHWSLSTQVVEIKNKMILNIVRSMLKNKKKPKDWAEVIACAVYLCNHSLTKKHIGKDAIRSIEWKKTKYFSFKSFWIYLLCTCTKWKNN